MILGFLWALMGVLAMFGILEIDSLSTLGGLIMFAPAAIHMSRGE